MAVCRFSFERADDQPRADHLAAVDRAHQGDAALGVLGGQRDPALLPQRPRLAGPVGGGGVPDLPPRAQRRLVVRVDLLDVDHAATVGGNRSASQDG